MSKNSSPSYEHLFYIDGTGISGVQDLNLSYSASRNPINILGIGHVQPSLSENLTAEISFSRQFIYDDPILSLTGDQSINGSLIYSSDLEDNEQLVIGFTSGYLTKYSVSCSINSTPSTNCTFLVFGKMGSGVRNGELDYSGSYKTNILGFANQGSIFLTLYQSSTNRITSFSQYIDINRIPIYDLKQKTSENYYAPVAVLTKTPIEVSTNFEVDIDDYQTANMMDNLRSGVYKNIGINIRDAKRTVSSLLDHNEESLLDHNDEPLQDAGIVSIYDFEVVSGNLLSESVKTSVDGNLSISLNFKNYYK